MEAPSTAANTAEQETQTVNVNPKRRKHYISNSSDDGLSTYAELAKEEAGEISKAWNHMVDTISAEPLVIQESVDMATTQPGNVVMAEILGLEVGNESSNFSPRELKVLMFSLARAVCYGIITHCFEQYRYESCVSCVIQAPAPKSHDCILWTKCYLCRKLSRLCGQISFKNVLHICLLVAYSCNWLLITKETVDQILQIVTKVGRAENSLN
ncbi:hypothetical protein JD844_013015 [Phrynosoma platyrhinos]|uniref:Uncharacterized protein n=1 Tax=Phrynosoma platyrhinos TaxID=52577 RepID=A0ABQ7TLG8_PHRPL|nr:hypothetical protein JD844_013015 [Phrynosoma platyrhinos]